MTADVYRPSCVVHLRLRFDDALINESTPAPAPTTTRTPAPPTTTPTNTPAGASSSARVQAARASMDLTRQPELLAPANADRLSWVMNVVPVRAVFELQSYRLASKFDIFLNFADLPIDPRAVRAAAVEVHIGTVTADDFARGMRGERDTHGRLLSTLRTRNDDRTPIATTQVLVGVVDKWGDTHGSNGGEVKISGRDLRGVLIDSPLRANTLSALDGALNIVQMVTALVETHPFGGLMRVTYNATEWPNGVVPAPYAPGLVPPHRRGRRGSRSGGTASAQGEAHRLTYWDAITRLCYLVGAIPYFRGEELVIRPSHSVFDQQRAGIDPSIATPFAGGRTRTVDGRTFSVRRCVYGRGVAKVSVERRMGGGPRPQVVRVVATNLHRPNRTDPATIEATWPPVAAPARTRTNRVSPGGRASSEDEIIVPVSGITDPQRLQDIARSVFEETGRNEITGDFESENVLASLGGDNQDPDLLRVRPGDAVEFYAAPAQRGSPFISSLSDVNNAPFEAVVAQYAARLNGDTRLARVLVGTSRGAFSTLQPFFRVANVRVSWDSAKGATVDFDFHNYIVRRFQVDATTDVPSGAIAGAVQNVVTRPNRTPSGGRR